MKQPKRSSEAKNHLKQRSQTGKRPDGELVAKMIQAVLTEAPGDWKTMALLIHDGGLAPGAARKLCWAGVSDRHISWRSPHNCAGVFEVEQTPRLQRHLKALRKTGGAFVCPQIAGLDGVEAQREWKSLCWKLLPQYAKFLKRFSVWKMMTEEHERLVQERKLPCPVFKPGGRDLKAYVNACLEALLQGAPPTGKESGTPIYNQYRALTKLELIDLAKKLDFDTKLVVAVSFFLLVRIDALETLDWDQFDLPNRRFRLSEDVWIPIHPALMTLLCQLPDKESGRLFDNGSNPNLRRSAAAAFRKAGVVDPQVRLSSVRKTAVLMLKPLGVNVSYSGKPFIHADSLDPATGDSTTFDALERAFQKLPDFLNASTSNLPP